MLIDREAGKLAIKISSLADDAMTIIRAAPQRGTWRGTTWLCDATGRTLEHFRTHGPWTAAALDLLSGWDATKMTHDDCASAVSHTSFAFKTSPQEHQLRIFNESKDVPAAAYFMEQQTGKSKVCIDKTAYHFGRDEIDALLIIAWPNGVHKNWTRIELPKHMPDHIKWLACEWSAQRSTTKKWQNAGFAPVLGNEAGVLPIFACNSDGLLSKRLVDYIKRFIAGRRVLVIFDEGTRFGKPGTKCTKLAQKIADQCTIKLLLTGTPVHRSPMAFYPMFNLLDKSIFGYESFYSFRQRYAVLEPLFGKKTKQGRQIEIIKGYKNLDEMASKVKAITWRVQQSDLIEREHEYLPLYCELTPKQSRLYESVADSMRAELEYGHCQTCAGTGEFYFAACPDCRGRGSLRLTAPRAITRLLRLHQICFNIFKPDDGEAVAIEEGVHPRLALARDWLSLQPGKVIIWAPLKHSLRELVTVLDKDGGAVGYWGEHSAADRDANMKRWRTESTCKYVVAHGRALGYGYRLTEARTMLFYGNTYSLEERAQMEARTQALDNPFATLYADLECEGTVETKIINALREKREISALITGDKLKDWL